jgi:predicted dehydrogenase
MPKKLRVGFIGAGRVAVGHWQRMHDTKKAEVVALTEPSRKSLTFFREHCPGADALPTYKDYKAMLKEETLDAVVVQSPHTAHYEQTTAALKQGLHVLSEKPLTCTIRHAKKLIALSEDVGRVLMISYQRHYLPEFRYIREHVANGAIGDVQFVQAVQSQEWLRAVKGTWRQKMAHSGGGQINDSGSHLIDILMWITGLQIAEVYAEMENFNTEVDINSTLALKFRNGALGSIAVIGNAPGWHEDVTVIGSKGAFYLRQGQNLIHQDGTGQHMKVKLPKYKKNPDANFVDVILGKDEPQTPAICGLRVIEVTEAAWKSAKNGRVAKVPNND